MTATTDPEPASSGNLEVVGSRVFPAPREIVFEAFSNPNHLVHWWGPKGFTNTFHQFELRPHGIWRLTMHGPDGATYDPEKHFVEVVPPELIVLDHLQPMHNFRMTMTYEDIASKTRLTWLMRFETAAGNEKLRSLISAANEENFDRLESYLQRLSSNDRNAS
jgi:uncharacterized protein YndB with AHSA1/START domain